ncbi:hypothetical protein Tco_0215167 [Tanacetum coccineum]
MKEVSKESGAKRKKSLPRKSTRGTIKRQKIEEETEKEDLNGYLDIVPREEFAEDIESLSTKYPIVDWKTCVLIENFMYYQVFRGDGSSKNLYFEIKQYFQIQDYALWEVIENGNSWVPIPVTSPAETGTSTGIKMTVPSTSEEKTCKKNDVKARSILLMALPNEHQLTFDQYVDAQSTFAAIKARFGKNEVTKKTQKALLKQQYENFSASSSESLDSIFNRLQRLVSRLAILGVVTPPEDLNVKFLRSLPSEWDTHVVVWMNKHDFDTISLDDLYNNFKIVEQKVKKSAGASNDDKNLAFVTTSGASSTNNVNTVNPEVSTATTKVNTARSQLVHEDLEQLHDDDLEEMDLKWNMALLSMRARKFYQRNGRKIIIDGSNTAGYDKSKGNSSKAVKIEDASEKAMCAIDGVGFDWSDMAEEEIQANMALMAFLNFLNSTNLRSSLKVDKDWKEKIFCPANHIREVEPKKVRENNDSPIIKDWVSDDEDDDEPNPKVEKKTVIPTATKIEFVKPETPVKRSSPKHNLTSSCNGSPSRALVKKYMISEFAEALTPL